MFKKQPRGSVQLCHNYPLGAIDHKGTGIGHQWQLTHVDFLLTDVLDCQLCVAGGRFPLIHDQPYTRPQGSAVTDPAYLALVDIKLRRHHVVVNVFHACLAGITGDGKHRIKGRIQTTRRIRRGLRCRLNGARVRYRSHNTFSHCTRPAGCGRGQSTGFQIQELTIRVQLHLQQIGRLEHIRPAIAATQPLLLGKGIAHAVVHPAAHLQRTIT